MLFDRLLNIADAMAHHCDRTRGAHGCILSSDARSGWLDLRPLRAFDVRVNRYACIFAALLSSLALLAQRRLSDASVRRVDDAQPRMPRFVRFSSSCPTSRRSNAPSLTTWTGRQRGWMGWWRRRSACWGWWRRSGGRSSPAPSPAASTLAPPSATPASPGSARFRRIGK